MQLIAEQLKSGKYQRVHPESQKNADCAMMQTHPQGHKKVELPDLKVVQFFQKWIFIIMHPPKRRFWNSSILVQMMVFLMTNMVEFVNMLVIVPYSSNKLENKSTIPSLNRKIPAFLLIFCLVFEKVCTFFIINHAIMMLDYSKVYQNVHTTVQICQNKISYPKMIQI